MLNTDAVIEGDLKRLEKWADRYLMKLSKEKCKALPAPGLCWWPADWKAASQRRTWVSWLTPS